MDPLLAEILARVCLRVLIQTIGKLLEISLQFIFHGHSTLQGCARSFRSVVVGSHSELKLGCIRYKDYLVVPRRVAVCYISGVSLN